MKNKIKQNKKFIKGFTLLELLVVVLIIGVLAAIALPQYKFVVAKSKYNTIKEMTLNIANSVERYYLQNGNRPVNLEVLDIDIPGTYSNDKTKKYLPNGGTCKFNALTNNYQEVMCFTLELGYMIEVYFKQTKRRTFCYAFSDNVTDLANKICQKETGTKNPYYGTCGGFCQYKY